MEELVFQVINDIQGEGALSNTQVNALYAHQLQVNQKVTILSGIQVGLHQRALDKTKLFFGDQIDPNYGFIYPTEENIDQFADNVSYADISLGFMAFTKKYFAGVAIHPLN